MAVTSRVIQGGRTSITQPYHINGGKGYNYNHWGIDLTGFNGSYNVLAWITAHSAGTVVGLRTNCTGYEDGSYGNYVLLRHPNGMYTMYAHLAYGTTKVSMGQTVSRGQVLAYMDNTGHSFGGHLHWEVRRSDGYQIDPEPYLNADLPGSSPKPQPAPTGVVFTYQIYDDVHKTWQPNVYNTNDFAGIYGSDVDCIYVSCNAGNVYYQVHCWGGDRYEKHTARYLPEVKNRSDFAGLKGSPIDGFALKADKPVKYRVHLRKKKVWLPWVTGYNWNDPNNGFAGIIGEPIDAIQIAPR